jgi:beta-phosphoglucomutase
LDGVIVFSEKLGLESWRATLAEYGLNMTPQQYASLVGRDAFSSVNQVIQLYNLPLSPQALIQSRIQHLLPLVDQNLDFAPGVIPLLTTLKDQGYRLAVASNSYAEYVHKVLDQHVLKSFFDCVLSGEDVAAGKPAPDIFLAAASCLQVAPNQCVVIEDSLMGVEAAVSAGMLCIAVPNPMLSEADFSPADAQFDSLSAFHQDLQMALTS